MARPTKQGLDYFALDVNMNDEVEIIEAEHGLIGFAILIKLFQRIYSEGYYHDWTDREKILFSNRVNVDRNLLTSIVDSCIQWGIFDKNLYETYNILTSRRIQNHYLTATYKRTGVEVIQEYLLIDITDRTNVTTTRVTVDSNDTTTIVFPIKSPQSKVKESILKDNKEPIELKFNESTIEYQLSNSLYKKILLNDDRFKEPNLYKWAEHIDKLIRLDERTVEEIELVINFVTTDNFEMVNVLSTSKLRSRFPQLYLKAKQGGKNGTDRRNAKQFEEEDDIAARAGVKSF